MDFSKAITISHVALMRCAQRIPAEATLLHPGSVTYLSESVVPAAISLIQSAKFVDVTIFYSPQRRAYITAEELKKSFVEAGFTVCMLQLYTLDVNRPLNLEHLRAEQEFRPTSFVFFITHKNNITGLNPEIFTNVGYLELFSSGLHIPGHEEYS